MAESKNKNIGGLKVKRLDNHWQAQNSILDNLAMADRTIAALETYEDSFPGSVKKIIEAETFKGAVVELSVIKAKGLSIQKVETLAKEIQAESDSLKKVAAKKSDAEDPVAADDDKPAALKPVEPPVKK